MLIVLEGLFASISQTSNLQKWLTTIYLSDQLKDKKLIVEIEEMLESFLHKD